MSVKVKWPTGNAPFYINVKKNADTLLNKTVVAVDPSSGGTSNPGYAVFENSKLMHCGEIIINGKEPTHLRLQKIYDELYKAVPFPDVLLIEKLRGRMVPIQLAWSVGVAMVAVPSPTIIEVPICIWKAFVRDTKPGYKKGNTEDAVVIGESVFQLAREL